MCFIMRKCLIVLCNFYAKVSTFFESANFLRFFYAFFEKRWFPRNLNAQKKDSYSIKKGLQVSDADALRDAGRELCHRPDENSYAK